MSHKPDDSSRPSTAPPKTTLIGVVAPSVSPGDAAARSLKSTLIGLSEQPAAPAVERFSPSAKSTLIGQPSPSVPPPESASPSNKATLIGMSSPSLSPSSSGAFASIKNTFAGLGSQEPPPLDLRASEPPPEEPLRTPQRSSSPEADGRAVLQAGALFDGRYRIVRAVSRGRLGTVYEAKALSDGSSRALKVLKPASDASGRVDALVLRDLRAVSAIVSDHIASVLDLGRTEGGATWFAAATLEGPSLGQRMGFSARAPLARREVWRILLQTAVGLEAAHAARLVHRDLRPSNILLAASRSGVARVKLIDFGLCHRVEWDRAQGYPDVSAAWAAPECQLGVDATPGADVWSFGLLAFWMFTGRSYWPEGRARLDAPIIPASERCAEFGLARRLPDGFDAWFEQCVARTARDRFASGRDLSRALLDLFHASAEADDVGFVPPVIVEGVETIAPVATPDTSARWSRSVEAAEAAPLQLTTEDLPANDIAPRGVARGDGADAFASRPTPPPLPRPTSQATNASEERPPADETLAAAEAMRTTRPPLAAPLAADRSFTQGATATTSRTAITAPFAAVSASAADDALETARAEALRDLVLDGLQGPASAEPPARYPVPLVSTRKLASVPPQRARIIKLSAALFAGMCGVLAIAWALATSEPAPTAVARLDPPRAHARGVNAGQVAASVAVVTARGAPRATADASVAAALIAPPAAVSAVVAAPQSASPLSLRGWEDGAVRAWSGTVTAPRSHHAFTLALRRKRRFAVAGFFVWDLDGRQVRENVLGTYDPSSNLIRVHGTSSSDPLRMPVGAYALRFTHAGALSGSAMDAAVSLTGAPDAAAAARVSELALPAATPGREVRASPHRTATRPSRP